MKTNSFFMLSLSLGLFFTSCSVEEGERGLQDEISDTCDICDDEVRSQDPIDEE